MEMSKPKNLDLELATLPDICNELQDRGLGYVLLVQCGNGFFISHPKSVKAATVMLCFNNVVQTYLQYAEQELEEEQEDENCG